MSEPLTDEQISGILKSTFHMVLFYMFSLAGMFLLGLWLGAHLAG